MIGVNQLRKDVLDLKESIKQLTEIVNVLIDKSKENVNKKIGDKK